MTNSFSTMSKSPTLVLISIESPDLCSVLIYEFKLLSANRLGGACFVRAWIDSAESFHLSSEKHLLWVLVLRSIFCGCWFCYVSFEWCDWSSCFLPRKSYLAKGRSHFVICSFKELLLVLVSGCWWLFLGQYWQVGIVCTLLPHIFGWQVSVPWWREFNCISVRCTALAIVSL